jgi:hypothetical protein
MLGRLKRELRLRHRMMRGEDDAEGKRARFFWALPEGGLERRS